MMKNNLFNKKNSIISFTSPKGGVGRTMTLANFANIYSRGVPWAGIPQSNTLLIDLDFNAPGIHYYNFYHLNDDKEGKTESIYLFNDEKISQEQLDKILEEKNIGLAFYFIDLINNSDFVDKCNTTINLLNKGKKDKALNSFKSYLFEELFIEKEYDPIQHLIHLHNKSLFIFPAGSPSNKNYNKVFFDFDWLEFLNYYLGDYTIKYLIEYTSNYIRENENKMPLRVLLDQQAGISIPGIINRSLAGINVYVTGLNKQNKNGLENLIHNHFSIYNNRKPWIILNQYNLREKCYDINTSIIQEGKSPHSIFRQLDNDKRKDFLKRINELFDKFNISKEKANNIFVTEFTKNAIQNEYFLKEDSISYNKLVEAIVSIEKELLNITKDNQSEGTNIIKNVNTSEQKNEIKIIGERVQLIDDPESFYGPFFALLIILKDYFGGKVKITGYAATHEQIATLIKTGKLENINIRTIKKDGVLIKSLSINHGSKSINLQEFDFISYPYYLSSEFPNGYLAKIGNINNFELNSIDCLKNINESYLKESIIGWNDYSNTSEGFTNVPLFVIPQLIAYLNVTVDRNSNFQKLFHQKHLRHFKGFNDPLDILDYAEISSNKQSNAQKALLCSDREIAKFYEWETISGIFNPQEKINNFISKINLIKYFFTNGAGKAIESYIKLSNIAEKTTKPIDPDNSNLLIDWEILLYNFFKKEENSLIFLWADTIPKNYRKDDDFIYQLPPAFHYFEESWVISVVNKEETDLFNLNRFLIYLMTKEVQQKLLDHGGIPVHKGVFTEIENWYDYPFLPHLWKTREIEIENRGNNKIQKRKSFPGYYDLGKEISNRLVDLLEKEGFIDGDEKGEERDYTKIVKIFRLKIIDLVIEMEDKELSKDFEKYLIDEDFQDKKYYQAYYTKHKL